MSVRRTHRRTRETNVAIMSAVVHSEGGRQLEERKGGRRGHVDTVGEGQSEEKEKNYGLVGHSTHSVYLFLHFFRAGAVTEMFLNQYGIFNSF